MFQKTLRFAALLVMMLLLPACGQVTDAAADAGAGDCEMCEHCKPKETVPVSTESNPEAKKDEQASAKTDEKQDDKKDEKAAQPKRATAVFAGGCFWCVEAVFEELEGVIDVVSGYSGGTAETAKYKLVSAGLTDHAEAVQITYDPDKITFEKLLAVHFATHDPTTLNRQGADVGRHYRSTIFYAGDEEKKTTLAMIERLTEAKAFPRKIVTTLEPLKAFHLAEDYHQNYACDNPANPYIINVALPKVEKVREKFKDDLKKKKE